MSIQEIRDLIAKKIAGQGTQVDVGGGLAAILNGILDLIPPALPAALLDIPNIDSVSYEAEEITRGEYNNLSIHPIISYYNGKPYLGVVCSDKQLVGELLSVLGAETAFVYISYLKYDEAGVPDSYGALVIYQVDEKYYKILVVY